MKKLSVAVIQSNYIPWKGYFDIINDAALFIFHDDLQYTKNDWRNRNKIMTPQGPCWLTVPVGTREDRLICEVTMKDSRWAASHWRAIVRNYSSAPFFKRYKDFFEDVYLLRDWSSLSEMNQYLIKTISKEFLGVRTKFKDSREYGLKSKKLPRLMELLEKTDATQYISGPTARAYIDGKVFTRAGVELVYKDYSGYPEYRQRFEPFVHEVSIIDVLFNTGPDAAYFIWGWRGDKKRK